MHVQLHSLHSETPMFMFDCDARSQSARGAANMEKRQLLQQGVHSPAAPVRILTHPVSTRALAGQCYMLKEIVTLIQTIRQVP